MARSHKGNESFNRVCQKYEKNVLLNFVLKTTELSGIPKICIN